MFYDVTLLTGADVKTFQGESGKKPSSGEKELAHQGCVCVCARACVSVRMCVSEDAGRKKERLCSLSTPHG